jgi:hypothetical protein
MASTDIRYSVVRSVTVSLNLIILTARVSSFTAQQKGLMEPLSRDVTRVLSEGRSDVVRMTTRRVRAQTLSSRRPALILSTPLVDKTSNMTFALLRTSHSLQHVRLCHLQEASRRRD